MNRAHGTLPLLIPLLVLGACRGGFDAGDPGLALELGISPTPPMAGPTRLIITLHDSLGAPVEGAEIVVEGNMSHAGMVPVVDTARAEGPGRYGIDGFAFTMAGEWVLTLSATLPDGRQTRLQRGTTVVAPPPGGGL